MPGREICRSQNMRMEQGRGLGDMWQWPVPSGQQSGPGLSGQWHCVSVTLVVINGSLG